MKIKISELCEKMQGQMINTPDFDEITVENGYMCDLLSFVIGRVKENSVWITVIGNLNTIAVAVLAEIPCIILAENSELDDDAKIRAEQNDIAVIKTSLNSFDAAVILGKVLGL